MLLKTIETDVYGLSYNEIEQLIETIIYKDYWDKIRGKYETPTQKNNRIQWILNDFPTYKKLSEYENTSSETYIEDNASIIGWKDIKYDLQLLYSLKENLEKEKIRKEVSKKHLDIWEHKIKSIELDLSIISKEKVKITKKLQKDLSDKEKEFLLNKMKEFSYWEMDLGKSLKEAQSSQRTVLGQTNNYKDKIEVKQEGELTLNQNIKQAPNEELLKKYADYIERIDKTTENDING